MSAAASGEKNQPSSSFPWEQQLCRQFSLAEIESVTQNFDEGLVIGRGGFGKVYKGPINHGSGTIAAIKRLDSGSTQGASEFWAEVEMLSKLRHCHLVSLIGYCNDGDEMILVYEHMPHGTLEDHLHKGGTILSWVQRLQICIGAARGLHYLHTGTGTQHGVIHRDVKSSNILLDENWAAKISDFGLSKMGPTNQPSTYVNTVVKGTFGYLDPEYFLTSRLTRKSDVYAFGVVLFEVLCGRRAIDRSLDEEEWGLARRAQECIEKGKLGQIIDSHVRGQISPKCLKEFAHIANRCLHGRPKLRPTMAEIVVSLELAMTLQERADNPTQPAGLSAFTRKMLPSHQGIVKTKMIAHYQTKTTRFKEFVFCNFRLALLQINLSLIVFLFLYNSFVLSHCLHVFHDLRVMRPGGKGFLFMNHYYNQEKTLMTCSWSMREEFMRQLAKHVCKIVKKDQGIVVSVC